MIDWNKPIETDDGRKVTVLMLNAVHAGLTDSKPVAIVKIEGDHRDKNGHYATYRMDGVMWLNSSVPKIRNVSTKREGWVNIYAVYETEEEAKRACVDLDRDCHRFVRWEE